MTVEPAHGVLNGDVQVPKRIVGGHLDTSPNGRLGPLERDLELIDLLSSAHGDNLTSRWT